MTKIGKKVFTGEIRRRRKVELARNGLESRGAGDMRHERKLDLTARGAHSVMFRVNGLDLHRNQVMELICQELCRGRGLPEIVRTPGMPSMRAVMRWMKDEPVFREAYEESERIRGLVLAEDAIDIARGTDATTASANKVMIDTLKWASSKYNIKFSDRQVIEHKHELESYSEEQLQEKLALMLAGDTKIREKMQPFLQQIEEKNGGK